MSPDQPDIMLTKTEKREMEAKTKWQEICAPIFDKAMGERLALMRMKMLMDQKELADILGIDQHTVSDLEKGRLGVPRTPFTVKLLKDIFAGDMGYILYGTNSERYNANLIQSRWHHERFTARRAKRMPSEHWTHRKMREKKEQKIARLKHSNENKGGQ
jgi:transcriptional regulator with XRE-family HTH domain